MNLRTLLPFTLLLTSTLWAAEQKAQADATPAQKHDCAKAEPAKQDCAKKEGPRPAYTIDNCATVFDRSKATDTAAGYQFWFADRDLADGQTIKMSVVAPHAATHPPHKHAGDEFFFILEGTAEALLEGKTKAVPAYGSFYCPEGVEHGIRNIGDTELKYLVIRKYPAK